MINSFSGEFEFLSNFSPSEITYEGVTYPTVEHAFQAAKTLKTEERYCIRDMSTPGQAKRAGRRVKLRRDWKQVKVGIMKDLLRLKFSIPELREKLLATGNQLLIEGNTWNDTFWGICNGNGRNVLGALLMEIRTEIKQEV